MLKKGFFGVLIILSVLLIWQLVKPYDYTVSFKSEALGGTINQTLKRWSLNSKNAEILEQTSVNDITQSIKLNDNDYLLHWQFQEKNEGLTHAEIKVKKVTYSITERLAILFTKTKFEEELKIAITDFVDFLSQHLKNFKVSIEGESVSPQKYCAYVSIKTTQLQKANWMMKTYSLLDGALVENNIKLDGRPRTEITYWDTKTDSIHFNFCYPIIKQDSLPIHPEIRYKTIEERKSIKATYNGNYITSDRAWYALLDYAEEKGIQLEMKPIEIFHNNPNMGGDELQWKTEVYIPIKTN